MLENRLNVESKIRLVLHSCICNIKHDGIHDGILLGNPLPKPSEKVNMIVQSIGQHDTINSMQFNMRFKL